MNLNNARALVTGGNSGIGLAIARMLADAGARVAITGRNQDRLNEAANSIQGLAIQADVSNEADVKMTVEKVVAEFGGIDILINNTGFGIFKPLVEFDRSDFDAVLATNVTGAMMMSREVARHFIRQASGNIINIASTAAYRGSANGSAYYASKFALRGMTECWRSELRRHNVRVMLISPSEVITDFMANAGFAQKDNPSKLHAEDIAHAVKSVLEMDDRGFTTEMTVFATNPLD